MSDVISTIGTKLPKDYTDRDAIHVPIATAVAAHDLEPGAIVSLWEPEKGNSELVGQNLDTPVIGIVDPFLPGTVERGEKFWVWLRPGTINSLRHYWTHEEYSKVASNRRKKYEF